MIRESIFHFFITSSSLLLFYFLMLSSLSLPDLNYFLAALLLYVSSIQTENLFVKPFDFELPLRRFTVYMNFIFNLAFIPLPSRPPNHRATQRHSFVTRFWRLSSSKSASAVLFLKIYIFLILPTETSNLR